MRFVGLMTAILFVAACSRSSESAQLRVRGELVWTSDRQTLVACDGGRVYYVRVLAATQHFKFHQRVEALTAEHPSIIADLEGEVGPVGSVGPKYPVDAVLRVQQTHSLEAGSCSGNP